MRGALGRDLGAGQEGTLGIFVREALGGERLDEGSRERWGWMRRTEGLPGGAMRGRSG